VRFKVDENLPTEVAGLLRKSGHDAITVGEQHLGGAPDSHIASLCQREARALVTLDTGFADIRAYRPEQFPGIIVLRLNQQAKPTVLRVVAGLVRMLSREPLDKHLWIVEEGRIRIRGESSTGVDY